MGRIAGDGSDILLVNGKQIAYQGIGRLRKDINVSQAVAATATDGYKKYFLESPDRKERIVVYGDRLDFSFEKRDRVPQVIVNGEPYLMAAFDNQPTSIAEGFVSGTKSGLSSAAGATVDASRTIIGQVGVATAVTLTAGTGYALYKGVATATVSQAVTSMGAPALKIIGTVVAIGAAVAGVAGGIKGASDVANRRHDLKQLASILESAQGSAAPDVPQMGPGQPGSPRQDAPVWGGPVMPMLPGVPGPMVPGLQGPFRAP
ncbi:MAG: hypothetical protein VKO21_12140 [Candidatus Sericytochromatia bacterium]|nr:hypothetical protein [Candidatus Sericytochromatia bacterium]